MRLQNIREAVGSEVESKAEDLLGEELLSHERITFEVVDSPHHTDYSGGVEPLSYQQMPDKDIPDRI